MHRLGALHQFRGVDYVEHDDDGSVMCLLCGTGWMFRDQRIEHFHGARHETNYNAAKKAEERARLVELNTRIEAEASEARHTRNARCFSTI